MGGGGGGGGWGGGGVGVGGGGGGGALGVKNSRGPPLEVQNGTQQDLNQRFKIQDSESNDRFGQFWRAKRSSTC